VLRDVGDPSPRPRRNKLTSATGEQIGHHPVQTNDKPSKHVLENVKMVKAAWDTVMNPEQNPLLQLPKVVRFQLMAVLAFMWSCIFCISAAMFMWIPEFVFGHVLLLLIGIFGTGYIFRVQNQ
jgi:hypothetical protein